MSSPQHGNSLRGAHAAQPSGVACSSRQADVQALQPARLQLGQRVLIHAGAGGVGHVAIQLAKDSGAHVTTTCSGSSAQFVKVLGAFFVTELRYMQCDLMNLQSTRLDE